nr:TetR/AcrR family transcriptional regulator [uncultured Mediterraneibacter sp.]
MNRSESKYFNTALKMDQALLTLLEKKDFSYITVKEICELAGVNRSTFYLHYETIRDLLDESIRYMNDQFLSWMQKDSGSFISKIQDLPLKELYLITPEYLTPYLNYIKDHQRLFRTAIENASVLNMENTYSRMFCHVFTPILNRYHVPEQERPYIMDFYIKGLMAVIAHWLQNGCTDSIDSLITIIQKCIVNPQEEL